MIARGNLSKISSHMLWAAMAGVQNGAVSGAWKVMDGEESADLYLYRAGSDWYIVDGDVVDADGSRFLGFLDDKPAWDIGSKFLHYDGDWILGDMLRSPVAWTRTTIGVDDGQETETAYGDDWHTSSSLLANDDGEVRFSAAGKGAMQAEIDNAAPPLDFVLRIGGAVSRKRGGDDPAGEYASVFGDSAGTVTHRVGFWSWALDGIVYAFDPSDATKLIYPETGMEIQCPGGAWTMREDETGAWMFNLHDAAFGEAAVPEWHGTGEGTNRPTASWNGLVSVVDSEPTYLYQPSRFL